MTVTELAAAIREGELSPVEITDHYLDRIDRHSDAVGAFYTVTHDLAREEAKQAEKAVTESRGAERAGLPPLTGIPIPIKDLNLVGGVRATFGCVLLKDNVAESDDYVVEALRSAGIVITGKTADRRPALPGT
jgi:amidase